MQPGSSNGRAMPSGEGGGGNKPPKQMVIGSKKIVPNIQKRDTTKKKQAKDTGGKTGLKSDIDKSNVFARLGGVTNRSLPTSPHSFHTTNTTNTQQQEEAEVGPITAPSLKQQKQPSQPLNTQQHPHMSPVSGSDGAPSDQQRPVADFFDTLNAGDDDADDDGQRKKKEESNSRQPSPSRKRKNRSRSRSRSVSSRETGEALPSAPLVAPSSAPKYFSDAVPARVVAAVIAAQELFPTDSNKNKIEEDRDGGGGAVYNKEKDEKEKEQRRSPSREHQYRSRSRSRDRGKDKKRRKHSPSRDDRHQRHHKDKKYRQRSYSRSRSPRPRSHSRERHYDDRDRGRDRDGRYYNDDKDRRDRSRYSNRDDRYGGGGGSYRDKEKEYYRRNDDDDYDSNGYRDRGRSREKRGSGGREADKEAGEVVPPPPPPPPIEAPPSPDISNNWRALCDVYNKNWDEANWEELCDFLNNDIKNKAEPVVRVHYASKDIIVKQRMELQYLAKKLHYQEAEKQREPFSKYDGIHILPDLKDMAVTVDNQTPVDIPYNSVQLLPLPATEQEEGAEQQQQQEDQQQQEEGGGGGGEEEQGGNQFPKDPRQQYLTEYIAVIQWYRRPQAVPHFALPIEKQQDLAGQASPVSWSASPVHDISMQDGADSKLPGGRGGAGGGGGLGKKFNVNNSSGALGINAPPAPGHKNAFETDKRGTGGINGNSSSLRTIRTSGRGGGVGDTGQPNALHMDIDEGYFVLRIPGQQGGGGNDVVGQHAELLNNVKTGKVPEGWPVRRDEEMLWVPLRENFAVEQMGWAPLEYCNQLHAKEDVAKTVWKAPPTPQEQQQLHKEEDKPPPPQQQDEVKPESQDVEEGEYNEATIAEKQKQAAAAAAALTTIANKDQPTIKEEKLPPQQEETDVETDALVDIQNTAEWCKAAASTVQPFIDSLTDPTTTTDPTHQVYSNQLLEPANQLSIKTALYEDKTLEQGKTAARVAIQFKNDLESNNSKYVREPVLGSVPPETLTAAVNGYIINRWDMGTRLSELLSKYIHELEQESGGGGVGGFANVVPGGIRKTFGR